MSKPEPTKEPEKKSFNPNFFSDPGKKQNGDDKMFHYKHHQYWPALGF